MDSIQGYKNRALDSLNGKWTKAAIAAFIVMLLGGFISSAMSPTMGNTGAPLFRCIWQLLMLPLSWGGTVYYLLLIRDEDIRYERLFDGYKDFVRVFLAEFLVAFIICIGCLLLIVPGVIFALMFSMTDFILKDDKEISCIDAMKQSAAMMKGHKTQLFWMELSFIGWAILSILTLGIGLFFLMPYICSTLAHFYEDLKAENTSGDE
ncbi:MAG: DUF975 family protein [Prevotella sp.]|nr:DUF975 family protein [Prevotella sp.]